MPNNTLLTRLEELKLRSRCEPENRNLNTLTCKHCKRQWWFDDQMAWMQTCATQQAENIKAWDNAAPALIAIARAAHDAKDCLACVCDSCEALRSALAEVEVNDGK